MPELPEVETVVRDLQKRVVGATIVDVWTDWPKAIKDPHRQSKTQVSHQAVRRFKSFLRGKTVRAVTRKGKNILLHLSDDHLLLIHQKMTGHLLLGRWRITQGRAIGVSPRAIVEDSYNHHVHLILSFEDGRQLGLSDVRKFAKVLLGPTGEIEALPELAHLGPDALDAQLTSATLGELLASHKRPIKQVLMDPFVIAGIGNIYSDDILWRARIHPLQKACSLRPRDWRVLLREMRRVLSMAVRLRGTSTSDFRDTSGREGGYTGHRAVYGRAGEPCRRCATAIARLKVGGRSAHFCPECQPAPNVLLARTTSR